MAKKVVRQSVTSKTVTAPRPVSSGSSQAPAQVVREPTPAEQAAAQARADVMRLEDSIEELKRSPRKGGRNAETLRALNEALVRARLRAAGLTEEADRAEQRDSQNEARRESRRFEAERAARQPPRVVTETAPQETVQADRKMLVAEADETGGTFMQTIDGERIASGGRFGSGREFVQTESGRFFAKVGDGEFVQTTPAGEFLFVSERQKRSAEISEDLLVRQRLEKASPQQKALIELFNVPSAVIETARPGADFPTELQRGVKEDVRGQVLSRRAASTEDKARRDALLQRTGGKAAEIFSFPLLLPGIGVKASLRGTKLVDVVQSAGAGAGVRAAPKTSVVLSSAIKRPPIKTKAVTVVEEAQAKTGETISRSVSVVEQKSRRVRRRFLVQEAGSGTSRDVPSPRIPQAQISSSEGTSSLVARRIISGRPKQPRQAGDVLKTGRTSRLGKPERFTLDTKTRTAFIGDRGFSVSTGKISGRRGSGRLPITRTDIRLAGKPRDVDSTRRFPTGRKIPGTREDEFAVLQLEREQRFAFRSASVRKASLTPRTASLQIGSDRTLGAGRVLQRRSPDLGGFEGGVRVQTRVRPLSSQGASQAAASAASRQVGRPLDVARQQRLTKTARVSVSRLPRSVRSTRSSLGGARARTFSVTFSQAAARSARQSSRIGSFSSQVSSPAVRSQTSPLVRGLRPASASAQTPAVLIGRGTRQGRAQLLGLRQLTSQRLSSRTASRSVPRFSRGGRGRVPILPPIKFGKGEGSDLLGKGFLFRTIDKPIPGPRAVLLGKRKGVDISL